MPEQLAPKLELRYLVMYGPICGGRPGRLAPFPAFYFPLLPPSIHLPHNEIQEHLLSPRLSKQAGSKPSQAFSQLAGLSASKALQRSCHHNSKCHGCLSASGFGHIWYSRCYCGQHPCKRNVDTLEPVVGVGDQRGWLVWPLSHEE